jgi:hypothetical protein
MWYSLPKRLLAVYFVLDAFLPYSSFLKTDPVQSSETAIYYLHLAGFLFSLFFGPEDGGSMFLRNSGGFLPYCTTLQQSDHNINLPF